MLLIIDNYDSFTYNLNDYFERQGVKTRVYRNDEIGIDDARDYQGIVISPGPGTPKNAGICTELIHWYKEQKPILGVCLGMQVIGQYFGAELKKAAYPMHGKVSNLQYNRDHPMFMHIQPPFEVCRYHSLIIESPAKETGLVDLAYSPEGELMAMAHRKYPLWAVQFHPEAILTTQGIQIIKNWLKHFNLH